MKITKGKVILIIIVVYFSIFAVININKEKDANKQILDEVVYVKDGKLDRKNDGKLVLVTAKISYDELKSFIELEDKFGSIKVNRKVEDYIKEKDEETGEYDYKWVERKESLKDEDDYLKNITSEEKISNITLGDYKLDDKGLSLIPTDKYYRGQEKIGELTTTGTYYERDPWEEDLKEGDMRISYKYFDIENNPYLSILAVQDGNTFIPYKYDKKTEIYQIFVGKVDNKTKLNKELDLNVKRTTKGKILFILMIIGLGIFFIVDSKKK